jgi:hypothetical protein
VTAAQRHRATLRPKSSVFTPKTAGSRQIPHPATPAATHPTHPKHAAFIRELPLQGEAPRGRPDLAFHARLTDLALQAVNAAELSHATNGFPRHHRLPTSHFPLPTSHFPLLTPHCPLPTAHFPLPPAHCPLPTSHCPLPTAHCPLPTAHCPLPTAIPACKASSTSPGCNPGSAPNENTRPVRAALSYSPGNAPPNAHVEQGCISKHRSTDEHRGVTAAQRNRATLRPKSSVFTPKTAGSRQIPHPATPATPHPTHPKHAAFI